MVRRPALHTEFWRTVRSSLGRFLALWGIVALGCGFYAGLLMCGPSMRSAADAYYDGTRLDDLRVVSTLGLTDEQLALVRATEGVENACGVRSVDAMTTLNNEQYAMRICTFPVEAAQASQANDLQNAVESSDASYLNRLVLAEGSWPSANNECLISADRVMGTPIKVGDTVEVLYGSSSLDDVLAVRTFTVSGLVHASDYVSSVNLGYTSLGSGVIQQFLFVPNGAFVADVPYTMVLATVEAARREQSGSNAYQRAVDEVRARLEAQSELLASSRLAQIKDDAQEQVDDASRAYETAKADADRELGEAKAKLDDAAQELEDAQSQLNSSNGRLKDSAAQLSDARAQIASGQAELDAGRAQYAAGKAEYEERKRQWDEAKGQLLQAQDALAQLDGGLAQTGDALAQLNEGLSQARAAQEELAKTTQATRERLNSAEDIAQEERLQLQELLVQLEAEAAALANQVAGLEVQHEELSSQRLSLEAQRASVEQQVRDAGFDPATLAQHMADADASLAQAQVQLEASEAELADAQAQLNAAQEQYLSGKKQYDSGVAQYTQGKRDYEAGKAELEQGKKTYESERVRAADELADAAKQLADAQLEVDELESPKIYLLDRTNHLGPASYLEDSRRIDHIAAVFPLIFFLVAALVALTTMTRMVDEERQEIGCHKALGYSRSSIAGKYLAYAALASVTGACVGIALLTQVLPRVVMSAYAIMYAVPMQPFPLSLDPVVALGSLGMGVGITLLSTWLSVLSALRESPAALMLPRAPKPGKRILLERVTPVWSRLSFLWKVTLRNIFRYKRRLLMCVVGIAGCTGLLLTGLGLRDSIWDIIAKQYEGDNPIRSYNVDVGLKEGSSAEDFARVEELIVSLAPNARIAREFNENMQAGHVGSHDTMGLSAVVPQDIGAFTEQVSLRDRISGEHIEFTDDSVVLTEKAAHRLGVGVGDEFVLYEQDDTGNPEGNGYTLRVSAIAENYVYHYCYVGKSAWRAATGKPCDATGLYVTHGREDPEFSQALHDDGRVRTVLFATETIDGYRKSLRSVNMIVVVLILAAAALAFIVLYNLTNINILERTREIASLKVLGFVRGEVVSYVFRETLVIVLLAGVFGLAFGSVLVSFVVQAAEVDAVMFGREVHLLSYVGAYLLTVLFSVGVMGLMVPKLKKIDMVESLKSVD